MSAIEKFIERWEARDPDALYVPDAGPDVIAELIDLVTTIKGRSVVVGPDEVLVIRSTWPEEMDSEFVESFAEAVKACGLGDRVLVVNGDFDLAVLKRDGAA